MAKRNEERPLAFCDGCRRSTASTVCGICLGCAESVLKERRRWFSRSEGNVFMSRMFGLTNYFKEVRRDAKIAGEGR